MKEYQSLVKDIKNKTTLPVYFLQGEESYYIDKITKHIEDEILNPEDKDFNLHTVYGLETNIDEVTTLAKQFPFGGEKQVVIVKEAQHLNLNRSEYARNELLKYIEQPQMQTVLVFNYKNGTLNGNFKLSKALKKSNYLFQSDPLKYEEQISPWISNHAQSLKLKLKPETIQLLAEHIGGNMNTIDNQLQKLKMIVGDKEVNANHIEEHVGISKDFNNFELIDAIVNKNVIKAFSIVQHFENNPKKNPMVLTVATLYSLFTKLVIGHAYKNSSDKELAAQMGVSPYYKILNQYKSGRANYSLRDATKALENLLEIDLKSKGVGANTENEYALLKEFLYKTFAIRN